MIKHRAAWALGILAAVGWMTQVPGQDHRHAAALGARGLFLRSAEFRFAPGTDLELRLVNGTYARSEHATSRALMSDISLFANGKKLNALTPHWRDAQNESSLRYRTVDPGTHVIAVSMLPMIVERSRTDFIAHATREGALDVVRSVEAESDMQRIRERSIRYARAIVQVGTKATDDFAQPLGHPIEILLENNPAQTPFGRDMSFRVLYRGKPLSNQFVQAGYDGYHEHDESGAHLDSLPLRTDTQGRSTFNLTLNTPWYICLTFIRKVSEPDADYESLTSSVTFDTR